MESPVIARIADASLPATNMTRLAAGRHVMLALAAMAAVMLIPLLSVAIPPLTDLPNHISRLHILAALDGDPALQSNYVESWGLIPNLAIDALGLPLARLTSPYVAGKAFAVLAFATALLGMIALHYAVHRSVNAWTGLVFFVAYNQCFIFGLLNFYFGIGLAFLLLAAWINYAGARPTWNFLLFPAGALAVYFSHLLAFGVYVLLVASYEGSCLLRSGEWRTAVALRRAAAAGAQFVAPAVLLLFTAGSGTQLDGATYFGSPLQKLLSLLSPFRAYVEPIDLVTILFLIVVLPVAWWRRRLRIGAHLAMPLLVLGVLAVVAPRTLLAIYGIDQRFAVVAGMLLFAAIRIELPARGPAMLLLALGAALLMWRVADLTLHWRGFDAQFAELRAAAKVMDRGASVLTVQRRPGGGPRAEPLGADATYWHVVSLAVVERGLFDPQTFTARHQPLKAHPDREPMNCDACRPLTFEALRVLANPEISWETLELPYEERYFYRHAALWPDRFDYVLVIDFGGHRNPAPDLLTPRHTGSFFVIYENGGRPRD